MTDGKEKFKSIDEAINERKLCGNPFYLLFMSESFLCQSNNSGLICYTTIGLRLSQVSTFFWDQ